MKRVVLIFALLAAFTSCKKTNPNYQQEASNPKFLERAQNMLTESIIHDIFAPPVSSRIYMYANVAGYEGAIHADKRFRTFVGQLNGFEKVAQPEALALTSLAIFDGFISCWDEKYRSIRIRPETVINASIDKTWIPVLQTPPFPEYTSGHSTISRAAAEVLTKVYGDNVAFNDSTEVPYGLPPRKFTSFIQASDEASVSRLYGGIHFRPALDEGAIQGSKVGQWLLANVKTRK